MDPIGFGLENFDPIGRWRTEISGQPVDASGVLTSGEKFNGAAELRTALLKKKDDCVKNLAERMLAYALCDDSGSRKSDAIAAAAASVLVLDRIDGFVYVGAIASAFLLVATSERRAILVRRVVGPAVVVFAAYHAWRVAYYHAILTPAISASG